MKRAAWAALRRCSAVAQQRDTIFALATPPGRSALAVVRASGPAAHAGVASLLACGAAALPPPNVARPARLRAADGSPLDDALLLLFRAPASATGEDVAEVQCHGGGAVVRRLLQELSAQPGWRPARAGEFARRAFHAGKLDLAQAEGLADLLRAETEAERASALAVARGALSRQAAAWRAEALRCLAHAEASIDFGEDAGLGGGLAAEVRAGALRLALQLRAHASSGAAARRELRAGVAVALGGAPNAGKSSLLNALASREAALVSSRPGTTRDVVEVPLALRGARLALQDTAGLRRCARGSLEEEGAARAAAALAAAPLRLLLLDASAPRARHVGRRRWDAAAGGHGRTLVLLSKADLLDERQRAQPAALLPPWLRARLGAGGYAGPLLVSARTGEGLAALCDELAAAAAEAEAAGGAAAPGGSLITRSRHEAALGEAAAALSAAAAEGVAEEVAAEELRRAAAALGAITGQGLDCEEVLDIVFSEFCIGK